MNQGKRPEPSYRRKTDKDNRTANKNTHQKQPHQEKREQKNRRTLGKKKRLIQFRGHNEQLLLRGVYLWYKGSENIITYAFW